MILFLTSRSVFMKMFKILCAVVMVTGIACGVIADENTPMITDGVVNLEQYLFGDVDSNGQTILHKFAENCDNDDFTVRLRLFDFLENFEKSESVKLFQVKMAMYDILPKEMAQAFVMMDANNFIQKKDNNGETALDIARKRNTLNPHKRCTACVDILEIFEKFDKELNQ